MSVDILKITESQPLTWGNLRDLQMITKLLKISVIIAVPLSPAPLLSSHTCRFQFGNNLEDVEKLCVCLFAGTIPSHTHRALGPVSALQGHLSFWRSKHQPSRLYHLQLTQVQDWNKWSSILRRNKHVNVLFCPLHMPDTSRSWLQKAY